MNPTGTLTPALVKAGDVTTFAGTGFKAGATVSASFPNGAVVQGTADTSGSVSLQLTSPPEPDPSGNVTASDGVSSTTVKYTVDAWLSLPDSWPAYGSAPIAVTGFGANETLSASFDSGPVTQTYTTDASGSFRSWQIVESRSRHGSGSVSIAIGSARSFDFIPVDEAS